MGDSGPDSNTTDDTKCMLEKMAFFHGLTGRSMPFTARGAKIPGTSHATQLPVVQADKTGSWSDIQPREQGKVHVYLPSDSVVECRFVPPLGTLI
jgi:hypothetical protein